MTVLDLGHGVQLEILAASGRQEARFDYTHPRPDGAGRCAGGGWLDTPGIEPEFPESPHWTVESWEPITLSPSLLCGACGHHGFVREDRWVPA